MNTTYANGLLTLSVENTIATLTLNNPTRLNALDLAMWQGGAKVLRSLALDQNIRVLVVQGATKKGMGKAFASGADISKFNTERATPESVAIYEAATERFFTALTNFPKPSIAKIDGYCIGGGLAIAICCDIRIAATGSQFAIPAGRLGIGYAVDGVLQLAALVGRSFAQEIFFTARKFDAAEAVAMGLINRVVSEAELAKIVDNYAEKIAANAPLTLASVKAITTAKDPTGSDRNRLEQSVTDCFKSEDYIEGRLAFAEKRNPVFHRK